MIAADEWDVVAVVLNWRDARRTVKCVESLLSVSAVKRVLIVDNEADGSLRAALESVRVPRVTLIEIPENRGFSGGVNVGLSHANDADAVLVINNDATIDSESVDQLLRALRSRPDIGVAAPIILNPDGSVQSRGGRVSRLSGLARQNTEPGRVDYLTWACVLVRGEALRQVGALDDGFFMYWEDVEFSRRVVDGGFELALVEGATAHHELSASAGTAGRRLASYYAWAILHYGDRRRGMAWLRSRIGLAVLVSARLIRRDMPGARAIVRGARLPRKRVAWRTLRETTDLQGSIDSLEAVRTTVHVNGKWLAQPITGTQRYATELMRRVVDRGGRNVVIHIPADADVPPWAQGAMIKRSRLRGHAFEQIGLPWATRGQQLLNLSGSSPLAKRRQIITLFDASVFHYGDTFSKTFTVWYRVLYRTAGFRSTQLITISEFSQRDLSEVLGLGRSELKIVPCGSEHFPMPREGTPPLEAPYVVVIGSLTERKNLAGTLNALARRGVRSAVVGAGGRSAVFASSAIPEDPHIVPFGRLSDQEIADMMASAVAMVFPSRYEGFGLPVVEAQRVGCPVVCSTASSLPEAAGDGALYFDPDDPEAAADHVQSLIFDSDLRATMIERGLANAARHSWEHATEILTGIIDREG